MPLRNKISLLPLAVLAACATPNADHRSAEIYDFVITGGRVYDGDGTDLGLIDIAVKDEEIVAVGPGLANRKGAARMIDADGYIIAPGFIDPHTHADADLTGPDSNRRANRAFAFQGVTTVIVGNDGYGFSEPRRGKRLAATGTNFGFLSGFGDLRKAVIGTVDRPATEKDLREMIALLSEDFCAGAFGFSAGLYYTPQNFASTAEVIALARSASSFGGYFDTHVRDESDFSVGVISALHEALEIGREAKLPVHIAHIKALGPSVWGSSTKMIEMVDAARAAGQKVTADQYPWRASGTRISSALAPKWALDGGLPQLRERLENAGEQSRIEREIADNIDRRGGAETLLITASLGTSVAIAGKTLAELAIERDQTASEVALNILAKGDARLASFNMQSSDINAFARQSWVMTGSDGSNGHPRKYATYPKAFRDWVGQGRETIGWFVRRSSGLPAQTIGLTNRGFLRTGMAADIVIFDPATFRPIADFQNTEELAAGVEWLLVNGVPVIERGAYSGALPGKLLRKQIGSERCATVKETTTK